VKLNEKNILVRLFFTWGGIPWKKPLIMVSCVHFLVMETIGQFFGRDIPPILGEIYKVYMFTVITAGFGSSTIEAFRGDKKKE